MQLLDLPPELLAALPAFLRNIEDFNNARSACRVLRAVLEDTHPNTILRLAAASAPTFFSPHPHLLVAATARQVANRAAGDPAATAALTQSFQGGVDGLLDLCVARAGLRLADIRRLHRTRFDVLNPLADAIDSMAGAAWYATPRFWDGGVSEPATLYTEPSRAALQLAIYGELFGPTMRSDIARSSGPAGPRLDRAVRIEFIKYCIPDWDCQAGAPAAGLEVLPVASYHPYRGHVEGDQVALLHIVTCARWKRMWAAVTDCLQLGPLPDERQQKLWWNTLMTLGLEGMELVTAVNRDAALGKRGLPEEWRDHLLAINRQIRSLDSEALNRCGIPVQQRPPRPPPADNDVPPILEEELRLCCRRRIRG